MKNLHWYILKLLILFKSTYSQSQFYGLSYTGGSTVDSKGLIFKTDENGSNLSSLYEWRSVISSGSYSDFIEVNSGRLFSMSYKSYGTIFEYNCLTNEYSAKFVFGSDVQLGHSPEGSLVLANDGKLYGMTSLGGVNNLGVIFCFDPITNSYSKLYDFSSSNGSYPRGSLIQANDGCLYGMTSQGGSSNLGVIFKYNITNSSYTKLFNFTATSGNSPRGSLNQASDGKLYGMTNSGGANSCGTIFEFDIINSLFLKKIDLSTSTGSKPNGSLMQANDGNLYGVTSLGGTYNKGVLFQYNYLTNTYLKKKDFSGTANGESPTGKLFQASDGFLYGLTYQGGANNYGVLFKYSYSTDVLTTLKSLDLNAAIPCGSVFEASNGRLYGLTSQGGNSTNAGAIFEYSITNNLFTVKQKFLTANSGLNPPGYMVEDENGLLYGFAYGGINSGAGVLFQFDPMNNVYTKKIDFNSSITGDGPDPSGGLMKAIDGYYYGVANSGGPGSSGGTLFRYNPLTNTLTVLVTFNNLIGMGNQPTGGLIQAEDSMLYGVTTNGGVYSKGVLYQYNPKTGVFTKKVDFSGGNGANPKTSLVKAPNGKLYGVTDYGGGYDKGVLFEYDISSNTIINRKNNTVNDEASSICLFNDSLIYGITVGNSLGGGIFEYNINRQVYTIKKTLDNTSAIGGSPIGYLTKGRNGKLYGLNYFSLNTSLSATIFEFDPLTNTVLKKGDLNTINARIQEFPKLLEVQNRIMIDGISNSVCIGGNILVPYKLLGNYNSNNVFTAQLSDSTGSFFNATNIGSLNTNNNGTINAIIPSGTIVGNKYRIRVVSSNPVVVGKENISDISITASTLPILVVNNGSVCPGESFTITPSGADSYTIINSASVVTPTSSSTYTIIGKDLNGCASQTTSAVFLFSSPIINISSMAICEGDSVSLLPTGSCVSYSYSAGSNIFAPLTTNTYTITGTDNNGCIGTVTTQVVVRPKPTINVNTGSVCKGQTFTLTPSGAISYTYSSGSDIVSPDSTTIYTITGRDANGCVNTVTTQVFVNPTPTVSILGATPICQGVNISLTGNGATTYTWSTNEISNSITVTPNSTTIYTVTGTDANNCVGTTTAQVSVSPSPTININNGSICEGQTYTFTPSGAMSYSYSGGNDIVTPTTTTDYTITGITANGCIGAATAQVEVNTNPIIYLTTTSVVCSGTSASITANGATTYTWNNGTTTSSINVTPTATSVYTVTGRDVNNCSTTQTVEIIVDNTCQDVWPGDANSDGVADNIDVLELGLHYTQTGTSRATIDNSWQSFHADNWIGIISNGKNVNHSDCNGDGTIDDNDTLAIFNNYGLTHAFKQSNNQVINPQLSIVPDQSSVVKGMWGSASVYLGDVSNDITNVNGVSFTVDFDKTLIEPNSIWIDYINSFINTGDNLNFRKADFANGKIYTATTHTLSNNVSGNGKIAVLHYQIKSNLANDAVLSLALQQANQSDASGNISPLTSGSATVMAVANSVGMKDITGNEVITVHPNPSSGILNIKSTAALQKLELLTVTSQVVIVEKVIGNVHVLDMSKLSNGVYILNVYQNNNVIGRQRIVLNK